MSYVSYKVLLFAQNFVVHIQLTTGTVGHDLVDRFCSDVSGSCKM